MRGGDAVMAWQNGNESDLSLHQPGPLTVDDLFLIILRAQATGADRLDVTCDEGWGYPKDIVIDESTNTMDDELEVHVTSFEPWP